MKNNFKLGFSLLEVSVVLLIVGILLASVSAGKSMIKTSRITSAQSLTANSPVSAVEGLVIWLEPTLTASFSEDDTYDYQDISGWQNITNYFTSSKFNIVGSAPKYVESSINDLPSVRFETGRSLDINSALKNITGTNFSIFIVEEKSINNNGGAIISSAAFTLKYDNSNFVITKGNAEITTTVANNAPAINYISFASSASGIAPEGLNYYRNKGIFFDGSNTKTINPTTESTNNNSIPSISGATLGAVTGGYYGDISEFIVYNNSLTTPELEEILNYLSSKYRIALNRE